jgi:putative transposase
MSPRPSRYAEYGVNQHIRESSLANLPPAIYAKISAPEMQREGTLRYTEGSTARPVAPPGQQDSNDARTPPIAG